MPFLKFNLMCLIIFAYMYVCALPVCSVHRGQKRLYPETGLELEMFVKHYVGVGKPACILWKNSQCPQPRTHLSGPDDMLVEV